MSSVSITATNQLKTNCGTNFLIYSYNVTDIPQTISILCWYNESVTKLIETWHITV
jgi:hypothetical protein